MADETPSSQRPTEPDGLAAVKLYPTGRASGSWEFKPGEDAKRAQEQLLGLEIASLLRRVDVLEAQLRHVLSQLPAERLALATEEPVTRGPSDDR